MHDPFLHKWLRRIKVPVKIIWGEADKVTSAVANLLSNAVKYVARDVGLIRVVGDTHADGAVFVVEDNGIGVPPPYQERIFGLFARLPQAHQRVDDEVVGGTGVGLALVKRIMEQHRGTVTVMPGIGTGCRFELHFPLHDAVARHAA